MFDKKEFNRKLKTLRKEKGYTQEQFSAVIGIKRNTYARYETDTNPSLEVFCDICEALRCTSDYLLFTPEPEPEQCHPESL